MNASTCIQVMYITFLSVTAIVSLLGVLHPKYNDSLSQCLGMSITCIGSVAGLVHSAEGIEATHNGLVTYVVGVGIYAAGTAYKKLKQRKNPYYPLNPHRHLKGALRGMIKPPWNHVGRFGEHGKQ